MAIKKTRLLVPPTLGTALSLLVSMTGTTVIARDAPKTLLALDAAAMPPADGAASRVFESLPSAKKRQTLLTPSASWGDDKAVDARIARLDQTLRAPDQQRQAQRVTLPPQNTPEPTATPVGHDAAPRGGPGACR